MKYHNTRHSIRNGDVLLFAGRSLWSRIIQQRTRSRISHCGLAVWIGDRLAVLEAHERCGVRLHPLSKHLAAGAEVYWYAMEDPFIERPAVVRHAFAQWGQPYAPWRQFLRSWGILTRRAARRAGLAVDVDPKRWFCSELVLGSLQAGAYCNHDVHKRISAETSPGDLQFLPCLQLRGRLEGDS